MIRRESTSRYSVTSTVRPLQDVLLIDEIGKMELFSENFERKVMDVFFGNGKALVIGTIPLLNKVPRQHGALFAKLHTDERVEILTVSHQNRNHLPGEIVCRFS